MNAAFPMLVTI